jgi:hypothetical protein
LALPTELAIEKGKLAYLNFTPADGRKRSYNAETAEQSAIGDTICLTAGASPGAASNSVLRPPSSVTAGLFD